MISHQKNICAMNKNIETEDTTKNLELLQENHRDEYWGKKYGVSADELKQANHKADITSKILEVNFKKKAYSF
jgi:hypothetical protein